MDVEEAGAALKHLNASLRIWRPRVVEYIEGLPFCSDGYFITSLASLFFEDIDNISKNAN